MTTSFVRANTECFSVPRSTGKERDQETGNDYFEARYYGVNTGRFMSPDWSSTPEDMPYAKLTNPQSLNLYSYMYNNPIIGADPTGHLPDLWEGWGAPPSALQSAIGAAATDAKKKSTNNPAPPPPAQPTNTGTASTDPPWNSRGDVLNILQDDNTCSAWFNQGTGNAYQIMSNVPILRNTDDPSIGGSTAPGDPKSPILVNTKGAGNRGT
jgi:RHS repeat-associated protein